jgi:hypothetical protein
MLAMLLLLLKLMLLLRRGATLVRQAAAPKRQQQQQKDIFFTVGKLSKASPTPSLPMSIPYSQSQLTDQGGSPGQDVREGGGGYGMQTAIVFDSPCADGAVPMGTTSAPNAALLWRRCNGCVVLTSRNIIRPGKYIHVCLHTIKQPQLSGTHQVLVVLCLCPSALVPSC